MAHAHRVLTSFLQLIGTGSGQTVLAAFTRHACRVRFAGCNVVVPDADRIDATMQPAWDSSDDQSADERPYIVITQDSSKTLRARIEIEVRYRAAWSDMPEG
jgi:hypothetical protein